MAPQRKRGDPRSLAGWPQPGDLSDEDVARLRSEMAATFGEDAAATLFNTFSGPLPPEVIEGLSEALGAGMPTVDDFLASHEELRTLVGDKRPKAVGPPNEAPGQ
jgi:hypothetical protein